MSPKYRPGDVIGISHRGQIPIQNTIMKIGPHPSGREKLAYYYQDGGHDEISLIDDYTKYEWIVTTISRNIYKTKLGKVLYK